MRQYQYRPLPMQPSASEGWETRYQVGALSYGAIMGLWCWVTIYHTNDPVARGGFTQVPNFILKNPHLSVGAKVAYAMFLSYAWHNESCFPGQERLAEDMGMSRSRVTEFISELERTGLVTIQRRGQGKSRRGSRSAPRSPHGASKPFRSAATIPPLPEPSSPAIRNTGAANGM